MSIRWKISRQFNLIRRFDFRWPNIQPYDFNRVRLKTPINGTDYINASHITGINANPYQNRESRFKDMSFKMIAQNKAQANNNSGDPAKFSNINFFASQGPLPNTCAHHLQMIFENGIDIVIMLTKTTEDDNKGTSHWKKIGFCLSIGLVSLFRNTYITFLIADKCEQYWPTFSKTEGIGKSLSNTKQFGHMEIHIKSETELFPDIVKRVFELRNARASSSGTHFLF